MDWQNWLAWSVTVAFTAPYNDVGTLLEYSIIGPMHWRDLLSATEKTVTEDLTGKDVKMLYNLKRSAFRHLIVL